LPSDETAVDTVLFTNYISHAVSWKETEWKEGEGEIEGFYVAGPLVLL
jgi:hypothetical protein